MSFHGDSNDTEMARLKRMSLLFPEIEQFVSMVRLEEGFLSKGDILHKGGQGRPPKSQYEALQTQIKKAQRFFGLHNTRCSRASAWSSWSRMVAAKNDPEPAEAVTSAADSSPLIPIEQFSPSHTRPTCKNMCNNIVL